MSNEKPQQATNLEGYSSSSESASTEVETGKSESRPINERFELNVELYRSFLHSDFLPDDVRLIHVSKAMFMPKRGLICASAILVGDPYTGIYKKSEEPAKVHEQWQRAYILIPKSEDWADSFFSHDVFSKRKSRRRFVPKSRRVRPGEPRMPNDVKGYECEDVETCILRTTGGYNEIWVNVKNVSIIRIDVRQQEGQPVEIRYPVDEVKFINENK